MNSCGITDNKQTVCILANRVFDNVRCDLDRDSLTFEVTLPYTSSEITPLYAGGTGTASGSDLNITPHYSENFAHISGNLHLSGKLTYVYSGSSYTAEGNLTLPFCAKMRLPEESVWPFEIAVHYSYFADGFSDYADSVYSCIADGIAVCYVTSCMPVTVPYSGTVEYNSISVRTPQNENPYISSLFYPMRLN